MSIVAVDSITDASGGNTTSINGIVLGSGVLDPENRIINGAFDFWQRGTSSTADNYVAADRWANFLFTGTVTQSRQAFALSDTFGSNNPTYFLRQTVSGQTLTSAFAATSQRIEGVRSYAGNTITVLGWARRSSGSGNVVVEGDQSFGIGGSPSANVTAISPTTITLTTSWAPFAAVITVPSVTGKTLGTNGNDFLQLNFWTSAGSDYSARTNSLGLQTIGVDLWGLHIKLGVHTADATALYKQPELGPELARCQRYYENGTGTLNAYYTSGSFGGGTAPIYFKQTKRAVPTFSATATTGFGSITSFNSLSHADRTQVWWNGSATQGDYREFTYTADAEL